MASDRSSLMYTIRNIGEVTYAQILYRILQLHLAKTAAGALRNGLKISYLPLILLYGRDRAFSLFYLKLLLGYG